MPPTKSNHPVRTVSIFLILGLVILLSGCTLFNPPNNIDEDPPEFKNSPVDQECYRDDLITLEWEVRDDNPSYYEIRLDTQLVVNETWDNSDIQYIYQSSQTGVHSISCTAYDLNGKSSINSVSITVKSSVQELMDKTTPIFNYIVLFFSVISVIGSAIVVIQKRG